MQAYVAFMHSSLRSELKLKSSTIYARVKHESTSHIFNDPLTHTKVYAHLLTGLKIVIF